MTQDFRHHTQDFRHKTSDMRLQTQDIRHQTQDIRHKTSDTRHKHCTSGRPRPTISQNTSQNVAYFLKHKRNKRTQKPVERDVRRVVHARRYRGTHHKTSDIRHETQDIRHETQDFRQKHCTLVVHTRRYRDYKTAIVIFFTV